MLDHHQERGASAEAGRPGDFATSVLAGLSQPQKTLPCRFFYDARGSELFEEITQLPEYYLTRAEIVLIDEYGGEIARHLPAGGVLIEFGSGSSRKTLPLLRKAQGLFAYIPLDISAAAVFPAAARIQAALPALRVAPLLADFTKPVTLPGWAVAKPHAGFFPGSTLGNFTAGEAENFLRSARETLGAGSPFIIGIDLQKPLDVLLPAYDDARGVTAAFNLNILARINRELGGTFDLAAFRHEARFNAEQSRVEMHLVSLRAQTARVAGRVFRFASGETIHTENSHKYTLDAFTGLAARAGWSVAQCWTGPERLFAIVALI